MYYTSHCVSIGVRDINGSVIIPFVRSFVYFLLISIRNVYLAPKRESLMQSTSPRTNGARFRWTRSSWRSCLRGSYISRPRKLWASPRSFTLPVNDEIVTSPSVYQTYYNTTAIPKICFILSVSILAKIEYEYPLPFLSSYFPLGRGVAI